MRRVLALSLAVSAAGACGDESPRADAPLIVEDGCQPLVARAEADPNPTQATCIVPYPSDFYRVPDPTTPTGFRLTLTGKAKPRRPDGGVADPRDGYVADGASTIPAIVATLPAAITREGLAGVTGDPALSMRPESATVLLEADTGTLIAHYTDFNDDIDDPLHPGLVIRPRFALRPRTRYVAAFAGVRAADGSGPAPAAEGFRRLRDRATDKDPSLAAMADRFERDVFAPLERAGVARDRLQLAWDFTTGSAESQTGDLRTVVDLTHAWLAATTPAIEVKESVDEPDGRFRRLLIDVTSPNFLDDGGDRARLFHGPDGAVAQHGTRKLEVLVVVPASVRDGSAPGRAIAMGHGFFGDKDELDGVPARTISERLAGVLFGINWFGMAKADITILAKAFEEEPGHVADFAERVHQSMADWLVVTALMKTKFLEVPELRRKDGGDPYDPSFLGYYGASQGGILGGTLGAIDADLHRVLLNVGGGGFVQMMPRSGAFGVFLLVLRATFPNALMRQTFLSMMQPSLDRIDPLTWASRVGPRILMQTGLGDNAVPNVGAYLLANALGAKQTTPAPLRIDGLPETSGGGSGPAITVWDYGQPPPTDAPVPAEPNPVHDILRINEAALAQTEAFLKKDGTVIQPCDGPCDPL